LKVLQTAARAWNKLELFSKVDLVAEFTELANCEFCKCGYCHVLNSAIFHLFRDMFLQLDVWGAKTNCVTLFFNFAAVGLLLFIK